MSGITLTLIFMGSFLLGFAAGMLFDHAMDLEWWRGYHAGKPPDSTGE